VNGPVWTQTVTNTKRVFLSVNIPEPSDPRQETIVKSAKLKLYKRSVHPNNLIPSNTVDRSVRIDIYQTILNPDVNMEDAADSQDRWLRKSIDSNLVSLDTTTGWEEFDVSMAVQDWIREPEMNFGFEVVCDSRYVMDSIISFVTWGSTDNEAYMDSIPVLNVLTQSRSILGRRRSERSVTASHEEDCAAVTTGSDEDIRCCRDRITVSFSEINWTSWVIEPQSFNYYFCRGTCPAGHRVAHQFSRIKSEILASNPSSPLSVRCTATRLNSLSLAHFTEAGSAVVSVFNDMYAAQCMCS